MVPHRHHAVTPGSCSAVSASLHERADMLPYSQGLHETRHTFVAHVQLLHLLENTADRSVCSNSFKGCSGITSGHPNTQLSPLCTHRACKEAQSFSFSHELCAVGLQPHLSLASTIHLVLGDFQS